MRRDHREVNAFVRMVPELTDGCAELSWGEVLPRKATPTLLERLALLLRPWEQVSAPPGTTGYVSTLDGRPLWRYKRLRWDHDRVFYLRPSPGISHL